jgi:hypothetical protein
MKNYEFRSLNGKIHLINELTPCLHDYKLFIYKDIRRLPIVSFDCYVDNRWQYGCVKRTTKTITATVTMEIPEDISESGVWNDVHTVLDSHLESQCAADVKCLSISYGKNNTECTDS